MEHSAANLTQIALVIVVALASGLGLSRLKQPPILGYILTGILLGPSCLAVIDSRDQMNTLAELGVLLLLFVVGMELSLRSFKKVWVTATLSTLLMIGLSILLTIGLSFIFNWPTPFALLLGFVISLSSTAVVVKMMEGIGESKTDLGQLAIGILIAQDLAVVPMILILKNYKTSLFSITLFLKLFVSIGLIVGLISYLSRRQRVRFPLTRIIAGEKELIPIASLTFCFGAAAIAGFVGLSAPYGAFLAGLILGNTHERLIMLETTHPIQSILMVAFFLSIGLLLDVQFIWNNLGSVLLLLIVITLVKTIMNIGVFRLFNLPWSQSFLLSVVLAQLGEFSFLMATVSYQNEILNETGEKLVVSLTVLSLAFSPLWMMSARRLKETLHHVHLSFLHILRGIYGQEMSYFNDLYKRFKGDIPSVLVQKSLEYKPLDKEEDHLCENDKQEEHH